ncbi:uncharacterized protein NEMAJ01_0107 [Nematocida major]|uniref:uncharacterized protein n=1 Tax=Nematocida major TaxID=1912982 RepID=UPI0020089C2B|nr:uncharacterized protein NEMAJ01_0107 [Nematocida major]KAH9385211.1 hypothetical protein NEMAJ01_0107 [Nematocida major]
MLISREHIISGVRTLQPTYDSINTMVEYIMLFPEELPSVIEIILSESATSNAHSNLFILYLLNELLAKHTCASEDAEAQEKNMRIITDALKNVLHTGMQKADFLSKNSTEGLKKSAGFLKSKYHEIEKIINKKRDSNSADANEAGEISSEMEAYLDIDYLESMCKRKDKKGILKYIKDLNNRKE